MKRHLAMLLLVIANLVLLMPWEGRAACRNPNIVNYNSSDGEFSVVPAEASGFIEIKWFGHSFFQITSSNETKIITDPFGAMGFPMPEVWPNVVTWGRAQGNHNSVCIRRGNAV